MDFANISLGGVALAPVIVAIIELLKRTGIVKDDWAAWVNAGLSVAAYFAVWYVGQYPESLSVASVIINALVVFLTGAGVYHVAVKKTLYKKR